MTLEGKVNSGKEKEINRTAIVIVENDKVFVLFAAASQLRLSPRISHSCFLNHKEDAEDVPGGHGEEE